MLLGHLLRLGLGIISSALLARALGPAGLGFFAVIGAATGILGTVADLGLRLSSIRHIAAAVAAPPMVGGITEQARSLTGAYTRLKLLGALGAAVLLWLLAPPLSEMLDLPASGSFLLRLGAVALLATAVSGLVSTLLHALRSFRSLVIMQSANVALTVLLMALLWGFAALTLASALVVGAVTAAVAAALGLYFLGPSWRRALSHPVSLRGLESERLLSFSRWMWLSNIFSILAVQVDVLLLNVLLPAPLVGLYALARNLAQKADMVNQSLHTVLAPGVSALSGRRAYRRYVRRSLLRSLVLGALMLLIVPLVRPFILLVYGSEYLGAASVFYALLLIVLLDLFVTPLVLLALPLDQPRLLAASDAIQVLVLLGAGAMLVPLWGVYGLVVARLASRLGGALVALPPLLRRVRA